MCGVRFYRMGAAIALVCATFVGSARANISLTSGNTVSVTGSNYAATVVEDVNRSVDLYDSSNDLISAVTVRDRVTASPGGTYNFERYLVNGPSGVIANSNIVRYSLAGNGFTGFATDVDFDPTTFNGSAWPQTVSRSAGGDSIVFNDPFQGTSGDVLTAEQQTDYLTIQTDATGYALTGTITVTGAVDGSLVTGRVAGFAPALPEPGTFGAIAGAGLILIRRPTK